MKFWLGTHMPNWMGLPLFAGVPLMVSRIRLRPRRTFPRAVGPVFIDSGGFSQLDQPPHRWDVDARTFAQEMRRYVEAIGSVAHISPQDWMCEPWILSKTGKTLAEHQRLTVENMVELLLIAPDLPWVPVVQGWRLDDYLRCVEQYGRAGVDLTAFPLVGVGSVCRRQGTAEAAQILGALASLGLKLHGFGFKLTGFQRCGALIASADSLAWSMDARKSAPLPGHTHQNCANCPDYALEWRKRVLSTLARPESRVSQLHILDGAGAGIVGDGPAVLPCAGCGYQPAELDRWAMDGEELAQLAQWERGGSCPLCGCHMGAARMGAQQRWVDQINQRRDRAAQRTEAQLALPLAG